MKPKQIELPAIRESKSEWDEIEKKIIELFRAHLYVPLMKLLTEDPDDLKTVKNSIDDLKRAVQYGRIQFYMGEFTGRFNASISKELKALGARWDRTQGSWKIPLLSLPHDVQSAISMSKANFERKIDSINRQLQKANPAEIADKLDIKKQFDATLFKLDTQFSRSIKKITVVPELSLKQRETIAEEWQKNMKLWVQEFTEKEISNLREKVQANVFHGNRHEAMVKDIQSSYDVSRNKAKFLARQETNLLLAKYKEARYSDVGVKQYRWKTVAGSPNHPVRPMHKALDGKIFSWDAPPVVNDKGERKNPGEDYNCRCYAIPIVKF